MITSIAGVEMGIPGESTPKPCLDGIFHKGLQDGFDDQMVAQSRSQMIHETDGLAETLVHQTYIGIGHGGSHWKAE